MLSIFHLILLLDHFFVVKSMEFNATVAVDGSGNYTTIQEAVEAAPFNSTTRYYIRIKAGVYEGHVEVPNNKKLLSFVGDDAAATIIVDRRSNATGYGTPDSATLNVRGDGFTAENLSIENSAGVLANQAVAVLVEGNEVAFYKCIIKGYQDTLFAASNLQFYKECDIYGSIDFIFGAAQAVFQNCRIHVITNTKKIVYITAQSKDSPTPNTSGFSFDKCSVTLAPGSSLANTSVYLGRPWRPYSTVVFMNTFLDSFIDPAGWHNWQDTIPVDKVYYAEYNNSGPGANTSQRVDWPSYHTISNASEASMFTVESFINGSSWLPQTGIPFTAGL